MVGYWISGVTRFNRPMLATGVGAGESVVALFWCNIAQDRFAIDSRRHILFGGRTHGDMHETFRKRFAPT